MNSHKRNALMNYYNKTMILLQACSDNNNLDFQYNREWQQWGFSLSLQTAIFTQSCFCVEFCKAIFCHLPYLVEIWSRQKHKVLRIGVIRHPPVNNFIRAPCCAHSENLNHFEGGWCFKCIGVSRIFLEHRFCPTSNEAEKKKAASATSGVMIYHVASAYMRFALIFSL